MSAYLKLAVLIAVAAIVPAVALYLLVPAGNHAAWRAITLIAPIAYVVSLGIYAAGRFGRFRAGKADAP